MLKVKIISSLEKVFLDTDIESLEELNGDSCFKNEKYSFQIVLSCDKGEGYILKPFIESEISDYIKISDVVNIPSEMPVYNEYNDTCVRTEPGLYPDMLRPLHYGGCKRIIGGQTKALWVEVDTKGEKFGKYPIGIKLGKMNFNYDRPMSFDGEVLYDGKFELDVKDAMLPEQKHTFSQWFYADAIADFYNVEMFSDEHLAICEKFIRKGVEYGRNMFLLPLLTPALDTRIGGERTTAQLVDIFLNGKEFTFGFRNLDRWLDMLDRCGVKYYEVSHIVTQWGAKHAPKVVVHIDNIKHNYFGWQTDSLDPEYIRFIRQLLKSFIQHMQLRGEDKKCVFHISDEPIAEHLERYKAVKDSVADILDGYPIVDALSHYEFYEQGVCKNPIPGLPHIKDFLDHNVPDLWCYYCGGHWDGVSNCHFSMPLSRTRFLGTQMFKYDIKGFLQWGYNFYNNQWSYDNVDPFLCSDGEYFGASGDTYMVYPGKNGEPYPSIRMIALFEGWQDKAAMEYCAELYSKEFVVDEIEKICGTVVFEKCVCESSIMLKIRHRINELVFEKLGI